MPTPDNALPSVAPLEVIDINDDGEAIAIPLHGDAQTDPPLILIAPERQSGKKRGNRRSRTVGKGDRILARLTRVGAHQYDAKIISKIGKHQQRLFGLVFKTRNGYGLEPLERKARSALELVAPDTIVPFRQGDIIEAEIIKRQGRGRTAAKAVRTLGAADAIGSFSALAIAEFELPHIFPETVIADANAARPPQLGTREDLRALPLVTIDGADARDFDDAVFAEPHGAGGYRMIVAIADVAHYVPQGSPLDREAQLRGNSVYLPDQVIPMLPETLSNGLCSLVPGEERACLAVEMIIDAKGAKISHRFMRGLMRSHARLTYDAVEHYRLGFDTEPPGGLDAELYSNLFAAYELRAKVRQERGALELDLPEKRVQFDASGVPVAIIKKSQSVSQKLIEEFMILANVAAAETLEGTFCVYRAHEPPASEKIDSLADMAKAMGLAFSKGQTIRPKHFNALLAAAHTLEDAGAQQLINETVLRTQSQADYRITNPGHFGLALRRYAHFTSPIRRYADLMVHRSIINHMGEAIAMPSPEQASEIAARISETERRATQAERRTIDRYATKLAETHAGKRIEGRVSTITRFGAFIEVGDTGAEGVLFLSQLPDDFYDVDMAAATIRGRRTGITIKAGEIIDVMVLDIEPLKPSITLAWADGNFNQRRHHKTKNRGGRRKKSHKKYR